MHTHLGVILGLNTALKVGFLAFQNHIGPLQSRHKAWGRGDLLLDLHMALNLPALHLLHALPALALELRISSSIASQLSLGLCATGSVACNTGVGALVVEGDLLHGESNVAEVEEGGDPGARLHRLAVLQPLHVHGVISHWLEPCLKVGEASLFHLRLIFYVGFELWSLVGLLNGHLSLAHLRGLIHFQLLSLLYISLLFLQSCGCSHTVGSLHIERGLGPIFARLVDCPAGVSASIFGSQVRDVKRNVTKAEDGSNS